jgi:hypothetical protein
MNMQTLSKSQSLWVQTIQRCEVGRQMMVTGMALVGGMLAGAVVLAFGIVYGSRVAIDCGVCGLLVAPIVCTARFNILRLYSLIQVLAPLQESKRGRS